MTQAYFTSAKAQPEPHVPAGWRVKKFDSLDGTNAALKRIVEMEGDAAEGLVLMARTQTAGRGRMDRTWESPEGNVYASILVKAPEDESAAPQVGFVMAVAVTEAILDMPRHNAPPPPVSLKWPNDVLVDGAKVCGILPELVTDPDGGRWIIAGLGINLVNVKVDNPAYPVGSLAAHDVDTTPEHAMTLVCRYFAARLAEWREHGFAPVRTAWLERGPPVGFQVFVGLPGGVQQGNFSGLDDDGALLLDTPQGRKRILAGDVLFGGGES